MKLVFSSSVAFLAALCFSQTLSVDAKITEETKTLDQLYADALAEGGNLVFYAGGDTPTQQDGTKNAFLAQFPKMNFTVVVDFSKYQDVRINNQFETNSLVPDVVALQTLQNFPRWANEGRLLSYQPAGWSKIYKNAKDNKNSAWFAYSVLQFSYLYNTTTLNGETPPATAKDLVDPKWFGKIASSYPHDDDAVLFLYTRYVEQYGWDWVAKLAQQNVSFARGSFSPGVPLASGEKAIGIGTFGLPSNTSANHFAADSKNQFLAWGQRMAIFKDAKHPAAAKLFANWAISEANVRSQIKGGGWSVRTDLTPPNGLGQIWDIPQSNFDKFAQFMEDRASVERWKQTFALYFGEVQGASTAGSPGLRPGL